MTSLVAKKMGRSMFAKQAQSLEPRNPMWETYRDANGVQRQRKRDMPLGLTKQEEKTLKKIRKRAHRLDKGFSICGFRFGWTAIIGIIPVVGDVVDAGLSYMLIIKPARKCGIPLVLTERMLLNQAVSTTIGLAPLVGDILIAVWKVNSRNCALFEDYLIAQATKKLNDPGNSGSGSAEASARAVVSEDEARGLVNESRKKGYINGRTGEKRDSIMPGAMPETTGNADSQVVGGEAYAGPSQPQAQAEKKRKGSLFGGKK